MKRAICPECDRPIKVCLCSHLKVIENKFPVSVFRHKSETGHALNTVNILQKSLTDISVFDGEHFEESLTAPNTYLVYPDEDAKNLDKVKFSDNSSFLLLDGSWKKTRKIVYLNPWLEKLPKIKLPFQQSRYFLRKQKEEGFSTLEAVASILSSLENNSKKYQPLLNCLDRMMELQASHIDRRTLVSHFGERVSKISSDKCDSKAECPSDHNNPDDTSLRPKTEWLQ